MKYRYSYVFVSQISLSAQELLQSALSLSSPRYGPYKYSNMTGMKTLITPFDCYCSCHGCCFSSPYDQLGELDPSVELLQQSGCGKAVASVRKYYFGGQVKHNDKRVATAASTLRARWMEALGKGTAPPTTPSNAQASATSAGTPARASSAPATNPSDALSTSSTSLDANKKDSRDEAAAAIPSATPSSKMQQQEQHASADGKKTSGGDGGGGTSSPRPRGGSGSTGDSGSTGGGGERERKSRDKSGEDSGGGRYGGGGRGVEEDEEEHGSSGRARSPDTTVAEGSKSKDVKVEDKAAAATAAPKVEETSAVVKLEEVCEGDYRNRGVVRVLYERDF